MKKYIITLLALLIFTGQLFAVDAVVNSISFDGTNDYILVTNDSSLTLTDDFTYNAWVNTSSYSNYQAIFCRYKASTNERAFTLRVDQTTGKLTAVTSTDGTSSTVTVHTSNITIPLNTWTMVTCRMTGGSLYLSANAGTEESFTQSTLHGGSANTLIGTYEGTGDFFSGAMSSIKIFDSSMSASDISSLYNSGKPRVHRGYGASIRANTVLAIEGGEDLPTDLYKADFDLLSGVQYNASYDSGSYADSKGNTISNTSTVDKELVVNGKDSLGFNGSSSRQTINSLASVYNGTYEGYLVFKKENSGTFNPIASWLQYSNSGSYSYINPRDTDQPQTLLDIKKPGPVLGEYAIDSTVLGDEWAFLKYSYDGSTVSLSVNGGAVVTAAQSTQFTSNDQVNRGALIRTGNANGTAFFNGQIAQDILFNTVNSAADQSIVENLLIAKFFPLHDLSSSRNKVSVQGVIMTGTQITFEDEEDGAANYYNLTLGTNAGLNNTGIGNTFLGSNAGFNNTTGENNVFIGSFAGYNETGSNKLYIANSDTATPLIYGEFDNQKLQVNGELRVTGGILANKVHVKLAANWPDYVFAEDYKLLSLKEVEDHINEHKHLPGIPPAKEIENGTLSVDEVMVKQMEKIEELTLYILKLKKENTQNNEIIEMLKKQNDAILNRLHDLEKSKN